MDHSWQARNLAIAAMPQVDPGIVVDRLADMLNAAVGHRHVESTGMMALESQHPQMAVSREPIAREWLTIHGLVLVGWDVRRTDDVMAVKQHLILAIRRQLLSQQERVRQSVATVIERVRDPTGREHAGRAVVGVALILREAIQALSRFGNHAGAVAWRDRSATWRVPLAHGS